MFATVLLCWSSEAFSGYTQEQRKLTAGKKKIIVQVRHVYSVSTFVWQNVTHLNCARIVTQQSHRGFLWLCIFLLTEFPTQQGQSKNQGRTGRQGSDGGNFTSTVLLCMTAVMISNLLRDGESKGRMEEDRNELKQEKDTKRGTSSG